MKHTSIVGFGSDRGVGAWLAWILLAAMGAAASGSPAAEPTPGSDGLAGFVPQGALVFVERRGHTAVRAAMQASNFGAMAADEAILKFVHESRVQIGKQIVKGAFDLTEPQDVEARQKQLHEVLKPFWYRPAAFCLVGQKDGSSPTSVFLCTTGPYQASCRKALEELMKIGVPAEGVAGTRQAFTYRKGEVLWKGVIKRPEAFELPKAPGDQAEALANGEVVMVCWVDDLLVVARGISGADAMSGMLSVKAPGASLAADKAYQAVAAGTGIKDWAFRWHVSVKAAIDGPTTRQAEENRQGMHPTMKALGLDRVVAVGGSEGFADKLVTRRLLVYAPEADLTMRLIRPNGSYQRGLAMTPRGAVLSLAGEIDTKVLVKLLFPPAPAEAPAAGQGDELVQGPATRPDSAPEEESAQAAITRLVQASDGHAAVYLLNMGMMEPGGGNGESGFPAGLVMGLKDAAQARQAVEQLAKLAPGGSFEGEREGGAQGDDEAQEASATQPASAPAGDQPETYRGAAIHRAGPAQIALLKDRVVVAVSRSALRAAVNAALDNKGGLPADGKTLAMVQLEGQGALLARIDMARLAKTYWPVVLANASDKDSILASIPTTEKIVSMLGSEVVLVQAVDGGILLKSRGYVPLLAKGPLLANFLPFFRFMP